MFIQGRRMSSQRDTGLDEATVAIDGQTDV